MYKRQGEREGGREGGDCETGRRIYDSLAGLISSSINDRVFTPSASDQLLTDPQRRVVGDERRSTLFRATTVLRNFEAS